MTDTALLEQTPRAFELLASSADELFVAELYREVHGREADPQGLAYYSTLLADGYPRATLVGDFIRSDEFRRRSFDECRLRLIDEQCAAHSGRFPRDYAAPGEGGRGYLRRLDSGFLEKYCSGPVVLDVGYTGFGNPDRLTAIPDAIGVDLDYPGYDGLNLPFPDNSIDTVFSSHCLEHMASDVDAIREWYRVLRVGGFVVCIVPSQALYEKRRALPSRWNPDHKRMYTPSSLTRAFEAALEINSFRVRHLAENDDGYNYAIGPERHAVGSYEIEMVIEKIATPSWTLA